MSALPPPPPSWSPPPVRRRPGLGTGVLVAVVVVAVVALAAVAALVVTRVTDEEPAAPGPTPSAFASETATPDTTAPDAFGGILGGLDLDAALLACAAPGGGLGERGLPDDLVAAIEVIADRVATQRGLTFARPVEPELLTADELAARVAAQTDAGYAPADAEADARILTALGALAPGTDLRAVTSALLAEQVAGFYDPSAETLVSLAGDELDVVAQVTLAHELDHALVDQTIGLPDLEADGDSDGALAALAVVEGDATLLMQRYLVSHLTMAEMVGMLGGGALELEQDALAAAPQVLQQQLLFPYVEGLAFVCDAWADGGWAAVDALYRQPPTTTAQILFPERHRAGKAAVDAVDPVAPGEDWEELRTDTVGAADLLWLFSAPGDDPARALDDPRGRAAAWAGGELHGWTRGDDTTVAVTLVDRGGAIPLCASVAAWWDATVPDAVRRDEAGTVTWTGADRTAVLVCEGRDVRLAIAPDRDTAAAAVGA